MRSRFLQPSVGNAIFALAAILIALMAIVAAINTTMSRRVGDLIGTINRTYVPVYGMLARSHIRSLEQSLSLRQAAIEVLNGDAGGLDTHLSDEEDAGRKAEQELAAARRTIEAQVGDGQGVEDRVLLGRLDARIEEALKARESYAAERAAFLSALRRSDATAIRSGLVRLDALRDSQNERLEEIRRESLSFASEAVTQTQESGRNVIRLTWLTLGFAVALGLLMAFLVTRRVVGAIRRLLHATEAVEQGRYDADLPVTSGDEIGRLTRAFNLMLAELRLKEKIRETFGRYMDPKVVAGVLDRPELAGNAGDRRVMTIAFVDMRGFTRLSGEVTPTLLITILNRYLTVLTEAVREHQGIVDKYTGDGVMAFWGPPFVEPAEQARLAVLAALDQRERFETFRGELPDLLGVRGYAPDLGIRIGIATGEVIAGNIGSAVAMNYTVMGEAVNIASRLEGLNKLYGTALLVSAATARMMGPGFVIREIDTVRVQGHPEPQTVYEVLAGPEAARETAELAAAYATGLAAYRARNWSGAADAFAACLDRVPGDGPSREMLRRVQAYVAAQPPGAEWDGVWLAQGK
ncbi:adenylate/guanylate cyclase domain-containing protein [Alsobacter sp. R-9]